MHMCTYMHICMHICTRIYVCICVHVYMHIYIYLYIRFMMITVQNNVYKHCKLLFTIYIYMGGWGEGVFMYVCLRLEEKHVIKHSIQG